MANNLVENIRQRVERVFVPSKATDSRPFMDMATGMGALSFESIVDVVNFYKSEAFNVAYKQMDPFSCYVMAIGNSWLSSTISAVARPIAASSVVASPRDPEIPDNLEIEVLNDFMEQPNPNQDDYDFKYELAWDLLCTGNNYIEVAYNSYGYPAAMYRHLPYVITKREDGLYQHKNGYVFEEDEMIHNKYYNPFSNKVGMSPIVPLVASVMLDSSILNTNMKLFEGGPRGLLSMDKDIPATVAQNEIKRIQDKVTEMRKKKESSHLAVFGMTWQAITSTNKDMMTPEMEKSIQTRICAVYGVPPAKVSVIESGNIGGGTGESQDETMNETLNFWGKKSILGGLNQNLLNYFGFDNTTYEFADLTKKDERRLAELDDINLRNGSTTLNRVLAKRGETLYDNPLADEPLIPAGLVPLSLIENKYNVPIYPGANPDEDKDLMDPDLEDEDEPEELGEAEENLFKKQRQVLEKLDKGSGKTYIVYSSLKDEL